MAPEVGVEAIVSAALEVVVSIMGSTHRRLQGIRSIIRACMEEVAIRCPSILICRRLSISLVLQIPRIATIHHMILQPSKRLSSIHIPIISPKMSCSTLHPALSTFRTIQLKACNTPSWISRASFHVQTSDMPVHQ